MIIDYGTAAMLAWLALAVFGLMGLLHTVRHRSPAGVIIGTLTGSLAYGFIAYLIPALTQIAQMTAGR